MLGRSTEIAISVHITLHYSINRSKQGVTTDVKLAIVNQKRLIKILLNDGRPVTVLR